MNIYKITSIGRPLDKNYQTNRVIASISILISIIALVYKTSAGSTVVDSLFWALGVALTVFLTWALGREVDPDHDASAFVGVALALPALYFLELPDFIQLFWFLLASRVINRTTGLASRISDSIIVLLLGSWLMYQGNWGYGLATILLFVLDSKMEPKNQKQWIFAAIGSLTTGILLKHVTWYHAFTFNFTSGLSLLLLVLGIPFIISSKSLKSKGDATGRPLSPRRVQTAQLLVLIMAVQVTFWSSISGFTNILPVWAAFAGAGIFYLFKLVT